MDAGAAKGTVLVMGGNRELEWLEDLGFPVVMRAAPPTGGAEATGGMTTFTVGKSFIALGPGTGGLVESWLVSPSESEASGGGCAGDRVDSRWEEGVRL